MKCVLTDCTEDIAPERAWFCESHFEDDEEYSKQFNGKVEFLSIPFTSWINLSCFLQIAGFKSFTKNLSVKKYLGERNEVEGDEVTSVVKVLSFARVYLLNKDLETFERLKAEGMFDNLRNLEIYETSEIKLDLFLKKDEEETTTINGIQKEAYYSQEENRLYVLKGTDVFSGIVAKEISRTFKGAERDVFPFLSSVLPKADDEEALETQLQLFGIKTQEEESYSEAGQVELLPTEEKAEAEQEEATEREETQEQKKEEEKVEPPTPPEPRKGLIDPDEYYISAGKEYAPYKRTEGERPKIVKEIKLREGRLGTLKPEKEPKRRTGTLDAEGIAIGIVINHEEAEGRIAEDRHKQRGIGYDVYSSTDDGEERFIEVKHFGEQEGKFKLTPHQLKKAKKEGNKYYVYIVVGLREEVHPKKLILIQNPLKWLTPDPPVEAEYSDWKNAVKQEFPLEKA